MDSKIINKIFPLTENYNMLKYDKEGVWSISLPSDADLISKLIYNDIGYNTIFDGTAGLGGNTISFAKYFKNVIAVEINNERFDLLKNNLQVYNFNNILLINDDYINQLDSICDGFFFDPPWGGPDYKNNIVRMNLTDLIYRIKNINDKKIFLKLPKNYDMNEFSDFNYKINLIKNYQFITIF